MTADQHRKPKTSAAHAGRKPSAQHGMINPPVWHASTVLYPDLDRLERAMADPLDGMVYGLISTPTSAALEAAVAELEHGAHAVALGSGLAAIAVAIMPFVSAGDHILMSDGCYGPARRICDGWLARWGIETSYYDPMAPAALGDLIRPNTKLVYLETPSSLTFEMPDIPALIAAAKAHGCRAVVDNTWASPLLFHPIDHGADAVVIAGTKYISGHSDLLIGFIVTTEETWRPIKLAAVDFGHNAAPDDCYLALRGLRSVAARLAQHEATALTLVDYLRQQPEIRRVLHPALPDHPGHAVWRRDFTGSNGLFAIELEPCSREAVAAMVEGMALFGIGVSWGGFESLILPLIPPPTRAVTGWPFAGPLIRLHAGLEDPADLIDDLAAALARLRAAT